MAGCSSGRVHYVVASQGGMPASAKRFGACLGTAQAPIPTARVGRRPLRRADGDRERTNGRSADRHCGAARLKTSPGSTTCAAATIRPSATACRAPDDVPCDRSVGGGRASSNPRTMSDEPPPQAWIAGVMNLGGGVAFRIASEDLDAIRGEIAHRLRGLLTAQDQRGWSAHVTIQNKVPPRRGEGSLPGAWQRVMRTGRSGSPD